MNIEEKISILNLSDERVEYLKGLKAKEINFYKQDVPCHLEIINVDDVVGSTRNLWEGESWFDILDKKAYKPSNFTKYTPESFDKILETARLPYGEDYPEVVKKDDKYYIAGGGLHRLTIAKCLGGKKALVAVRDFE